eukprot:6202087-Pleurochrysis_carterae.AAC.2
MACTGISSLSNILTAEPSNAQACDNLPIEYSSSNIFVSQRLEPGRKRVAQDFKDCNIER